MQPPQIRLRVVVADDSLQARRGLSRELTNLGHAVVAECSTPDEAVHACAEHRPDVAFIDLIMPQSKQYENGHLAAEAIKKAGTAKYVVAITAISEAELRDLRGLGIHTLRKPVSKDRIAEKLTEIVTLISKP